MITRDLGKEPLSIRELETLIGSAHYQQFLNPRNELYRERKMKEHPPCREEALGLMSRNPNLIRRPITIRNGRTVLGYDSDALGNI